MRPKRSVLHWRQFRDEVGERRAGDGECGRRQIFGLVVYPHGGRCRSGRVIWRRVELEEKRRARLRGEVGYVHVRRGCGMDWDF